MYVENRTKIATSPCIYRPAEGFPLELCVGAWVSRN